MKIDIHVHTKKTKSGDSPKRNVDQDRFATIVKSTDVGIIAITNHNHFDHAQFVGLSAKTDGVCKLWPGVELDIAEDNRRGHLLVIVNPKNAKKLEESVSALTTGSTADNFTISIEETVKAFDKLDAIYIAHYQNKKPALNDSDIAKIQKMTTTRSRVIKEATDALSAGIFISHGHLSIYGSDVQNWDNYAAESEKLPDLRLPVDSFEQFCLLLQKDEPTINTLLNKKQYEPLTIQPFPDDAPITLTVFNDINVFFGSKGTGKTEILKSISKAYNKKGLKTRVYEASTEHINDQFDIKGSHLTIDLAEYGIDDCKNEIAFLRNVAEVAITNPSQYAGYFSEEITNERAKKIKVNNFKHVDAAGAVRKFDEIEKSRTKVSEFIEFALGDAEIKKTIDAELHERARTVLNEISSKLRSESEARFVRSKSFRMFNGLITFMSTAISRKTGKPEKPTFTGFANYARNRIAIERNIKTIKNNIQKPIVQNLTFVGDLGEKGSLYCRTEVIFQTGDIVDGKFSPLTKVKKTPQKDFSKAISGLSKKVYDTTFFESLAAMQSQESVDTIGSIADLLLFYRHFINNDQPYSPSSGESSMLLLHKELSEEKDVYLLDEPEKSLGNDYINDVIVPMLKERARMGKKIFIATHDANIAVRTLPYNSIYRKHSSKGYTTYLGNPFSNHLTNLSDTADLIDWKEISMKTLEGGKEAFGERGKIYGNV